MLRLFVLAAVSATPDTPRLFAPGGLFQGTAAIPAQTSRPQQTSANSAQRRSWRDPGVRLAAVPPAQEGFDWGALYRTAGVQKTLELAVITAFGFWLRTKLTTKDAGVVQKLLLSALVPAVIFTSLCSVKVGIDSLSFVAGGLGLVLLQNIVGHLAAYTVFGFKTATMSKKALSLRRTAVMEMGTMAPALSVFAFVTEFVGPAFTGLAALIDLPMKAYMLLVMPSVLKAKASKAADAPAASGGGWVKGVLAQLQDPFNASIIAGITLSVIFKGEAMAKLGFAGTAFKSLAAAQTPVLFLLIGLKLSIEGATPNLCGVLLLLRQGLVMMAVKTFLLLSGIQSVQIQLLITLASQAATSVVGLGQITKAKDRGDEGYNTDFAFDIIGISFPLTILLNTAACLGGSAYIASMYPISLVLLAFSGLLYKVSTKKIADALEEKETELPLR
jgi:hypothetical protein